MQVLREFESHRFRHWQVNGPDQHQAPFAKPLMAAFKLFFPPAPAPWGRTTMSICPASQVSNGMRLQQERAARPITRYRLAVSWQ
jgi:ribonuclease I